MARFRSPLIRSLWIPRMTYDATNRSRVLAYIREFERINGLKRSVVNIGGTIYD